MALKALYARHRELALLVGTRLSLLVVLFVPAQLAARAGWRQRVGGDARYTERDGPLPLEHVVDGLTNLSPAFLVLAALAVALLFVADQLLVATAFRAFSLTTTAVPPSAVALPPAVTPLWRTAWTFGVQLLPAYLRVAALGAALAIAGLGVIDLAGGRVDVWLQANGASGATRMVALPAARLGVTLGWLSLVGALGFWCRALLALDERRRVLRAALEVTRVFWRAPLTAPLLYLVVTASLQAIGPVLLLAGGPPRPGTLVVVPWTLYLVAQASAWGLLVRSAVTTYAAGRFDDLRARGDVPLLSWRRLRARLGRRRAEAAVSPSVSP